MSQAPPPPGIPQMMSDPAVDPNNGSYYPPENDLTGGLPINLDSLRDGPPGSKPFYPYSTLIRYAIKGSPNQKLLLEDIYYAIESRFPYFRSAPSGWKNSVRHNLSLNPCFEKVPRPLTDRGKGSYWTVNDNVDPRTGVHRVRKKKSKNGKGRGISEDGDIDYAPPEGQFQEPQYTQAPPMVAGEANGERPPGPFPPAQYPPPFDPNFPMIGGIRFPPAIAAGLGPIPISPDEGLELDENGNVNWQMAWLKEIGHLQQVTAEQEKAGADQEWYRMMLHRVRMALMLPIMNPDAAMMPHIVPTQPAPVDTQQSQPPQQQ